jgi:bifunctional DNA-binding transcriptional regulator/antitoxin component of YhaV-PrlF toxin-antitoxin module
VSTLKFLGMFRSLASKGNDVPEVVVTRGAQITLTRDVREKLGIREGDVVTVNTLGGMVIITKRDPEAWRRSGDFLPENFEKTIAALRGDARARLERLGFS